MCDLQQNLNMSDLLLCHLIELLHFVYFFINAVPRFLCVFLQESFKWVTSV